MGKVGGTSWLTAVKKVFRSPTKTSPKKSCKRREEHVQDDEEEGKKSEKRRWIFRKLSSFNQQYDANTTTINERQTNTSSIDDERHAIAAAEASAAAAKAAVASAQAAVIRVQEIIPAYLAREYYAALIIQTSFRGYLARRALRALKGIVKLQALVRGSNIRKQAKTTLKCMQTLIRVQAKLRDNQSFPRLSHGQTRKSMYAEGNNFWDKYKDIHQRRSMSEDEDNIEDQYKNHLYTIEDIEAMLQGKKEASLHREQALAYALTQQIRRFDRKICPKDENKDAEWLSQWLDSKECSENYHRLTTHKIEAIKNIDIESLQPPLKTPINFQRSRQYQDSPNRRHSMDVASPLNSVRPMTPTSRDKGFRSQSAANTPSLRASCPSTVSTHRYYRTAPTASTPNYMAATASAKARARTQSTPRQRHSTSERERGGSAKKRLSFPNPEPHDYSYFSQNLKSPSFRSVQEGLYHLERGTTCSSYTDITGGEVSPASTSHLRRWLS